MESDSDNVSEREDSLKRAPVKGKRYQQKFRDHKDLDLTQPPDVFWHQVSQLCDQHQGENAYFKHLPKFMLAILSLPHSNAECEKVFSKINDIKTKKRNKLFTKSIKGNLLTQQAIQRDGKNCVDFNPTNAMIKKHTIDMYKNCETIILSDSNKLI